MYDQANNLKVITAIAPKASLGAAAYTGVTIDRAGFESLTFAISVGVSGDTLAVGLKVDFDMEESDNGSNWNDVDAADVIAPNQSALVDGTPTSGVVLTIDDAAEDDATYVVGYRGGKRYARINSAKTGTHTVGMPGSAVAILGNPARAPV